MSTKKVVWNEKISATEFNTIYPRTVAEQVVLNNTINNNLGIDVDSRLDTALEHISDTDKRIRAQGTSTGTSGALELSVPVFTLIDGIMARVKIHTDTAEGATLNVNNTGAKPIVRIDGEPIDLVLKQGTWCIFIYSSTLDSWIFEGWSTKTVVKSAIYTESGSWTVPANVTSVDVFLMGGGGGAGGNLTYDSSYTSFGGGGGAGRLKKQQLTVTPGQSITVTIGVGGTAGVDRTGTGSSGGVGSNGGSTSFGTLLSATGGNGGGGGSTPASGGGGNGGAGSAGGGGGSCGATYGGSGGNGDYCGGGGASSSTNANTKGGNGGTYGGGGGSNYGSRATGGQYGGAGGVTGSNISASAGTNTMSMTLDFIGEGKAGVNGITKYDDTGTLRYGGGAGGGGYGGNGGDGQDGEKSLDESANTYGANGGGGGYGGNGGAGLYHGGGGGGYGGDATGSGGGGYGASNFGRGGNTGLNDSTDRAGKSGICIITWTAQEA